VLDTVGPLGVFASSITGFDIFTAGPGQNTAYASFDRFLYTVDLATGTSTFIDASPPTRRTAWLSFRCSRPFPNRPRPQCWLGAFVHRNRAAQALAFDAFTITDQRSERHARLHDAQHAH
jgi:hypothetical protein